MLFISNLLLKCDYKKPNLFAESPDVFKSILSYLPYSTIQHTVTVSTYWKKITLETTTQDQFTRIQNLAKLLGQSNNYAPLLDCKNLPEIKTLSLNYLELFIDYLKKLDIQELDRLEILSEKPRFFEKLFELSRIYQKKERDYAEKEPKYKYHFLATELLKQGHVDEAFKVASTDDPSYNFLVIANQLAANGQIAKAIEAVNRIPNKDMREFALKQVRLRCFQFKNLLNPDAWMIIIQEN